MKRKYDYCTLSPDKVFGVYIGCACKKHDKAYSKEGRIKNRLYADKAFFWNIFKEFRKQKKRKLGFIVALLYFLAVRIFGVFFWKQWSSNGLPKYL